MPYTPPSQQSPADSKSSPSALSSAESHENESANQESQTSPPSSPLRPGLPRSTSSSQYLSKHRRGPSLNDPPVVQTNDYSLVENSLDSTLDDRSKIDVNGSLRQSPPPVNNALIPTGAMISPPDSSHNSSDDEENTRGRSRELDNLAALQEAIRNIEQRKQSSPTRDGEQTHESRQDLGLSIPEGPAELSKSFSADDIAKHSQRLPLSREARKISHSRSSTDSSVYFDAAAIDVQSPGQLQESDGEDDDDEDLHGKPPMVRKKSGELVRPALRPSSAKRRPSSMPGTPTYSKAVHFDSHLEHVRHFLQVDKPLAVSAGSSPVENFENEVEFPFGSDERTRSRGPQYEWEIKLSNFPTDLEARKHWPVRVERAYLSSDNKNLICTVAVQNLAYHKSVNARFTFDYWKTTSEVAAEYNNDVRRKQVQDGCDRFNFSIRLTDIGNLENKTLFFCVKYSVHGQEYWDNNNSINYQIDFAKKAKSSNQKSASPALGARPLSGLPRSRPSPLSRPRTSPSSSFDDFSTGFDSFDNFGHSPESVIGDPQLILRNPRARAQVVPDAPARRTKPASSQAFGNRYDFGASLSAAIQNASSILGEQSGIVESRSNRKTVPRAVVVSPPEKSRKVEKPAAPVSNGASPPPFLSEKPSHQSQSYQELVDKYCFVGSRKTTAEV